MLFFKRNKQNCFHNPPHPFCLTGLHSDPHSPPSLALGTPVASKFRRPKRKKKKKHDICPWTCSPLPKIWYHTLPSGSSRWITKAVPAGSDILFPVLNGHVQECVMWKVCLLQCASLIMVFPSISVSHTLPPSFPPTLPYPPPSLPRRPLTKTLPLWGGMFCH